MPASMPLPKGLKRRRGGSVGRVCRQTCPLVSGCGLSASSRHTAAMMTAANSHRRPDDNGIWSDLSVFRTAAHPGRGVAHRSPRAHQLVRAIMQLPAVLGAPSRGGARWRAAGHGLGGRAGRGASSCTSMTWRWPRRSCSMRRQSSSPAMSIRCMERSRLIRRNPTAHRESCWTSHGSPPWTGVRGRTCAAVSQGPMTGSAGTWH